MIETHDLGLLPEYEIERRSEGRTPWDAARDPKANPVKLLAGAADLANQMDPKNVPALTKLLAHQDPAMRFWGAVGLVALGAKASPAAAALRKALKDPAPNPRVAAAEALSFCGGLDDALPVLVEALRHESAFIRLRAMNALERLGPKAKPAAQAMRAAAMTGGHAAEYVTRMAEYVPARLDR